MRATSSVLMCCLCSGSADNTGKPGCNDMGVYDALSVVSDIL
jgi:hypothetical protein